MTKPPLTIWTMNASADLLATKHRDICSIFEKSWDCRFGDRSSLSISDPAVQAECGKRPDNLMLEDEIHLSEYFVPIAAKCLGRWADPAHRPARPIKDPVLLEKIVAAHRLLDSDHSYTRYWDQLFPTLPGMKMVTKDYMGYYELLSQSSANVIVGYSEGGLVARFCAFLDEHVFGWGHIKGFITIASPNFGSPLANPLNCQQITDSMIAFLTTLLGVNPPADTSRPIVLPGCRYEDLIGLINGFVEYFQFLGIARLTAKELLLFALVKTVRKAFSGLDGNPESVFRDLDISRLAEPFSVMGLVNDPRFAPVKIPYAAILTADDGLDDFVRSFIPVGGLIGRFLNGLLEGIGRLIPMPGGLSLHNASQGAAAIYRQSVMQEYGPQVIAHSPELQEEYNRVRQIMKTGGIVDGKAAVIKPRAHDFVIPSAYQLYPVRNSEKLLGITVNTKANHNSGKLIGAPGGKKNYDAVVGYLRKMV